MSAQATIGEAVRAAFLRLDNGGFDLSDEQLLVMMKAAGVSFQIGMRRSSFALHRKYYETPDRPLASHKISSQNEGQLRRFFYDTPLGRSLLEPNSESSEGKKAQEALIATLFSKVDGGQEYAGLYYVLHGSYRHKKHRAIHMMEITYTEDGRLIVLDEINDNKVVPSFPRKSSGTMTIFNQMPQIITYGKENRVGFSLFVGGNVERPPPPQNLGGSHWMLGMLTGITDRGFPFSRKALIVKRVQGPTTPEGEERFKLVRESMLECTGIFGPVDIMRRAQESEEGAFISRGFRTLQEKDVECAFEDPLRRKGST